jgi:hypothetical protein
MSYSNERTVTDKAPYLEVSAIAADAGEKVGKLPGSISVALLKALGCPTSPIKAIRAKCLECCCGDASEVRKCVAVDCALWPMRMGHNPFHALAGDKKRAVTGISTSADASELSECPDSASTEEAAA